MHALFRRIRLRAVASLCRRSCRAAGAVALSRDSLFQVRQELRYVNLILTCSGSVNDGTGRPAHIGRHARRKIVHANARALTYIREGVI